MIVATGAAWQGRCAMARSTRGTRRPAHPRDADPIEVAIETALDPGRFISYREAWSFVDDVQAVANDVEKIIDGEPERAARLYETFIAACHLKAEEIDDSSGSFGMVVDDLFRGWMRSRQSADADASETARMLLAWMEDDPYGFCHHLDREAVKVLDKHGLAAFSAQIRAKYESSTAAPSEDGDRVASYARRRWGGALKILLAAQRDIDSYVAVCEQTEFSARDCKTIAEMHRRRRRPQDALSWVERGLEVAAADPRLSHGESELRELKRSLLARLGHAEDALASAWNEFEAYPSTHRYRELMRYVPAGEKQDWHDKAMEASEGGDLRSQIDLWLKHKEMERLATRIDRATEGELEDLSHYTTEPLAKKLERSRPDLAARLCRALGMRIVNAGKSKYYDAALDHLEHAKKLYAEAGLPGDWDALVVEVRQRHYRKKGFMAGFEDIAAGTVKPPEPTFLERARQRWPRGRDGA